MTLDEAILHAEEVADYDAYGEKQCKCAEEHRQLAEWLKDYKRLLEREPIPDNATNGDMIKAMFPYGSYGTNGEWVHVFGVGGNMRKAREKMEFELGKNYIVSVTEKGIIPLLEFDISQWYNKNTNDLDFLTEEEKAIVVNNVLGKIKSYINYIRNTGLGKKKTLEFIEKFIDGLKVESEE